MSEPNANDNLFDTFAGEQIDVLKGHPFYVEDSGDADALIVNYSDPALAAADWSSIREMLVKVAHTNTGASTINPNGAGARNIKKDVDHDLEAGDLVEDGIYWMFNDGVNVQLQQQINNQTVVGPLVAVDENIMIFDGVTGDKAKDSGVSISTDDTMTGDSDSSVPTEAAVKGYVDTLVTNSSDWDDAYTHATTEDAVTGLIEGDGAGNYSAVANSSSNWNAAYTHKTTIDAIAGVVECDGAGNYSVAASTSSWNAASIHASTQDALTGLILGAGDGTYTTVTDNSTDWNTVTDKVDKSQLSTSNALMFTDGSGNVSLIPIGTAGQSLVVNGAGDGYEWTGP
jgi:hypothetical protein